MQIHDVRYIGSFPRLETCPKDEKKCFAFIGRSNVGKSSLINMLTGRINIARVSKSPGKTQSLNYYLIDESWYLVDLPGYGYAKVSKKLRKQWEQMIEKFLVFNENLITAFVLIDSRHDLQQVDLDFINWLGERRVPFNLVYTKTDKLKPPQVPIHVEKIQISLLEHWNQLPRQFITSSVKREGREEFLNYIYSFLDVDAPK